MTGNVVIKAKKFFSVDSTAEFNKWIRTWTTEEQNLSLFFVITRKIRKNTYVYFKFVIGDSILGEVDKNYDSGIARFNNI